jgi:glycosyltransferase involved in cell wall biosynthesis
VRVLRGLYLDFGTIDIPGYANKIYGQVDAFCKNGIGMDIISLHHNGTVTLRKPPVRKDDNAIVLRRFRRNFWNNRVQFFTAALEFIANEKPEVLYIRLQIGSTDFIFLRFLHTLRKVSIQTIVFYDIPTFPYDLDMRDAPRRRIRLEVDRFCRQFLKNYIDRIIAVDYDEKIFGVKTLSIQNGVDVDAYPATSNSNIFIKPLKLIGVAHLRGYHGYDRIITAIHRQLNSNNKNIDIEFHIVGSSTIELSKIMDEVNRKGLTNYVVFHGQKVGADLDFIFNKCHIGVGTLAWHRVNVSQASTLKSREYMARGIPFIYAAKDQGIPQNYPYAYQVPSNDEPLNFQDIFNFTEKCFSTPQIGTHMREYAKNNFSWSAVMNPILTEIEKIATIRNISK